MKRFAYGCFGVLCLAIAFHLGALSTGASFVDHSSTGIVAASKFYGNRVEVLDEDGVVWWVYDTGTWTNQSYEQLPVPVSHVKFWCMGTSSATLVTVDDHVWFNLGDTWTDCGAWPGGSSVQPRSWGSIKAEFGGTPPNIL